MLAKLVPDGFGWRKYECPVPLLRFDGGDPDPACRDYLLWPSEDSGRHRRLTRWEGLEAAFLGFVSRGFGPPEAVAYSCDKIFKILESGSLVTRSWVPGSDAAEAVEFVKEHLLGVWMGARTPFIVSITPSWDAMVRQNVRNFV